MRLSTVSLQFYAHRQYAGEWRPAPHPRHHHARSCVLVLALGLFAFLPFATGQQNPTNSSNSFVTIAIGDLFVGSSSNKAIVQFMAPSSVAVSGLVSMVTMTFFPKVFAIDALPSVEGSGGEWSRGLFSTYYDKSYNSSQSYYYIDGRKSYAGGLSNCHRVPHPSFGLFNHSSTVTSTPNFLTTIQRCLNKNSSDAVNDFAMRMSGFINIPSAGTWTFYISSDDGSRLYINHTVNTTTPLVNIQNWPAQSLTEASGTYTFTSSGLYPITIEYFQDQFSFGLFVRWSSDFINKAIIPASAFVPANTFQTPVVLVFNGFSSASISPKYVPLTITMTGLKFAVDPAMNSMVTFQTNFDAIASQSVTIKTIAFSVQVTTASLITLAASGASSITLFGSGFSAGLNAPGLQTARAALGRPAERGSNCQASDWTSATSVICKIPRRASANGFNVIVSLGDFRQTSGSMSKTSVYSSPLASIASSQRLSNISVIGFNYGLYLADIQRPKNCAPPDVILSPRANHTICNSSILETGDASATVTDAAVSITFSDTFRLDDVTVSLKSPRGTEFTLMQRKCFGAPRSCAAGNSISFNFQILPIAALQPVPLERCPTSGTYVPDDVISLRMEMLSQSAIGLWTLHVASGSQTQNISFASFTFKTGILDFRIGNSSVTSIEWTSDSSASMKTPGYQRVQEIESSSGFGRNHSVTALAVGIETSSSCNYSYPDPVIANTSMSVTYSASGSYVMLLGRYFSNANLSGPRSRVGISACAATRWQSDSALTCSQAPSLGSIRSVAVTIQRSNVASLNATFLVGNELSISRVSASNSAMTADSVLTLIGAGFGLQCHCARVRLRNALSASSSTVWRSDSSVLTKLSLSRVVGSGLVISLASVVRALSEVQLPLQLWLSQISKQDSNNVPTTGASVLRAVGARFGSFAESLKASLGLTCCLESRWSSDSSIACKAPSGMPNPLNSFALFATSSGASVQSSGSTLSFDAPVVNGTADVFSNNSNACFFNSSGVCVPGFLIRIGITITPFHASSGFGTCPLPPRNMTLIQGTQARRCDITSWTSDSSMHCLYSAAVSLEFRDLQIYVEPIPSQMTIKNAFFVPATPPLSNETLQLRFYQNVSYPAEGEDKRFREFGILSGFEWSESSLIPTVLHSQVLSFSLLAFIRSSQCFLDSKYLPIETNVSGSISVFSSASGTDVTSIALCDRATSKNISFLVPPRTFWAKMTVSLAFCAPSALNGNELTLRANLNVRNANGNLSLSAVSPAFHVNSSGSASISLTSNISPQLTAANDYNDLIGFRFFFGSRLDDMCEQGGVGVFKFSVALVCDGQITKFRSSLASVGGYMESTQCSQSISAISFIRPAANCSFNVSALTDGMVSKISPFFEVVPGLGKAAMLIGSGPFCASAGAIIWSVNSTSDGLCLVAQLQDAEGNNVTAAVDATVVARSVNSSEPDYQIAPRSSNTSSASGLIRWCDAYSSKTQSAAVVFGASVNGMVTYWTSSFANVSTSGLPSNLVPVKTDFSNQTVLAGTSPQKLSFSIQDAGQNSYQGPARVAIRVRVVPRLNATFGRSMASIAAASQQVRRRLLQSSNFSDACARDAPLEFLFLQNVNSTEIFAGPDFLCRAGVNDVFFDIGTYDAISFSATGLSAFTMNFTVNSGAFKSFALVDAFRIFFAQSYRLIDSLEIVFLDTGLNEVVGNATMALACMNTSAFLYSSESFTAVSYASVKAFAPPFFLSVKDWQPMLASFTILLAVVNSSIPQYGPKFVTVQLNWTCSPGYHVPNASLVELFTNMKMINKTLNSESGSSSGCVKCSNGTVSKNFDAQTCSYCEAGTAPNSLSTSCIPCDSNSYKYDKEDSACRPCPVNFIASLHRDSCFTLDFQNPPSRVSSGKIFGISGISIRYLIGPANVTPFPWLKVLVALSKKGANSSSASVVASLHAIFNDSKWSSTLTQIQPDSVSPSSDFFWSLKLLEPAMNDSITFGNVSVSVLDVSFIIAALSSPDVPFTGSVVAIDCVPLPPFTKFFMPMFTVPNITNTSCVFIPTTAGLESFSQPAHFAFVSSTVIKLQCELLSSGQLGPVFSVWKVRAVFPDGRDSPESSSSLTVRCPAGMFIEANVTSSCSRPPCCLACPSPMSVSVGVDRIGIQSCTCAVGYYGSFGLSCTACPKSAKFGFNCTVAGLKFPLVKPGFYIDYSLLSTCSEESCSAVVKCPNPLACPGFGERNCLNTDDECYSDRSVGCTLCCANYYSDNFLCRKCPESRLLVVLTLAILLLIAFAILSSFLSFPPFVASTKGLKLVLSGLQSFACIRLMSGLSSNSDGVLSGVNWPPIMLSAFEFMNTFTFSFDSLRPECSFEFSARTKLILMTTGPFFVSVAILLLAIAYSIWKIYQLYVHIIKANLITDKTLHISSLFRSIAHCFIVSTFSMKYSRDNQVMHGSLWPALDPGLIQRSDISALVSSSKRRSATLARVDRNVAISQSDQLAKLPLVWKNMVLDFQSSGVSKSMSVATSTTRLLISSALSVFIFTFQGVLETLLSTWDCKVLETRKFLRYRPNIECSISNSALYSDMVVVSSFGLVIYTFVMPLCVVIAIRSRWAREIYTYNYLAYEHLFGFITSQYTASFFSWEAVNCFRKMSLIAIPIVVTPSPIVQSLSNILLFFAYAMIIIGFKPMASPFLNKIEVLNSFNIIVSSFAAMMFTIQYENAYVLQGDSREIVGIFLVVFIASIFLSSIRIIYIEAVKLFSLHQNLYLSKWLCVILSRTGGSILLDKYLPISLLFFNKTSRKAIQDEIDMNEANRQRVISGVSKSWFSSDTVTSFFGYFVLAWTRIALRWKEWKQATTYEIHDDLVDKTLAEPDYEFFVWMHKLLQRVAAWKPREKELRHSAFWQLPKQFTASYGESDPPIAICDSLLRTSRAIGDILNEDHKDMLLAFLLQDGAISIRANLDDGKCDHYQERMRTMVQTFKKQLSKHVQACETFRNETEARVHVESCRPLRQQLYGARQSEDVKVLRCISSTTLPQYWRLAQSETDKRFADDRSATEAVTLKQLSPTVHRRGGQGAVCHQLDDAPTTKNEIGIVASVHQVQRRHSRLKAVPFSAGSATSVSDGMELEEIIVESLDDAQAPKSSGMRGVAMAASSPAEPSTSKRLSRTRGAGTADLKDLTAARPDFRRTVVIPSSSSAATSAVLGARSPSKIVARVSPQPQPPAGTDLARRFSFLQLYDLHYQTTLANSSESEGIELGSDRASSSPSPTIPTAAAAATMTFNVGNKGPNQLNSTNFNTRTATRAQAGSFFNPGERVSTINVAHHSRQSALSEHSEDEPEIQQQHRLSRLNEQQLQRIPKTMLAATAPGSRARFSRTPADKELRQIPLRSQQRPNLKPTPFAVGSSSSHFRTHKPSADDGLPPPPSADDRAKSIRPA